MNGNVITMLVTLVAKYAAYSVSIGGCHQPKEPAVLKKLKKQ